MSSDNVQFDPNTEIEIPRANLHANRHHEQGDPGYNPRLFRMYLGSFLLLARDATMQSIQTGNDDRGPFVRQRWTRLGDGDNGAVFTETRIVGTPLPHYPMRFDHRIMYTLRDRSVDLSPLLRTEFSPPEMDVLFEDIPHELRAIERFAYYVTEIIAMRAQPFGSS